MALLNGSRTAGTRALARVSGLAMLTLSLAASADTVKTVNGVDIDSSVLDAYIQSRTQRPATQSSAEERATFLTELTDVYLLSTQESASAIRDRQEVKAQIELQTLGIIAQAVAAQYVDSISVNDEEVQAEYDAQAALAPPLQYKARHILVESQGAALDLVKELDGGADFAELATSKSTGPSGPNGGDLGWFSPNQMVKPFSDAVVALEDGSYTSQPVQTEFGWHVILREDSRETDAPPLESVRDTIVQALRQKKFQAYLDDIRAGAED